MNWYDTYEQKITTDAEFRKKCEECHAIYERRVMAKNPPCRGYISNCYRYLRAYTEEYDKEIRDRVIDEFVKESMKQFTEFGLKHGYPTVADCKIILREIAEQMKR